MPRAHALLLESIHPSSHEVFAQADVAVQARKEALGEDDLIAAIADMPGDEPVIVGLRSKTKATERVLRAAAPRLSAVGAFCIGTDQIALGVAQELGIVAFNAPFSSTRSVAELVIGEIVMLARRIFPRDKAAHAGTWAKSAAGAHEIRSKTLGIIGYGHIGSQVSVLAESMGLNVIYYDVVPKLPLGNARPVESLEALLAASDFVTLHVPRSPDTRYMIKAAQLGAMKAGSYLINLSRGDVVEIDALRDAVESKHLSGAAVDVYPVEPAKAGHEFETPLAGLDNVILTPHIGGSTQEAQANIGREVATALNAYLAEGSTLGSVTLPEVEAPRRREGTTRVYNVHRNVPGVLSAINRLVADSELNVVTQRLATNDEVGVLVFDAKGGDNETRPLARAIDALETTIRTRMI